jgi:hypothetical protein
VVNYAPGFFLSIWWNSLSADHEQERDKKEREKREKMREKGLAIENERAKFQ